MCKLSNYDIFKLLGFEKYNFLLKIYFSSYRISNLPFLSWLECGIFGEINEFRISKRAICNNKESTEVSRIDFTKKEAQFLVFPRHSVEIP